MTAYICSSLRPKVYDHVTKLIKNLDTIFTLLRPTSGQLENRLEYVELDVAMIKHADEVWIMGEFGRDCSWEIGYACGLKKKIVLFLDETNAKIVEEDWMLHHGINTGLITITDLRELR